jgi:hypothetical protein
VTPPTWRHDDREDLEEAPDSPVAHYVVENVRVIGRRVYRVWVDETGDRGMSAKSSPFLDLPLLSSGMSTCRHFEQRNNRSMIN